ncbi:hypothetical protein CHH57_01925 [Niallia circulans]|uniref:Uncharacterized protein n=1 Tax=Niallia circulans TaxID=1397 RepID=A0AA91TW37_NIACI|nr:hypothetical protein [Niallia circulans]PAD84956.1 hypothetical protein CHH57_01925 [Niallia circulans]
MNKLEEIKKRTEIVTDTLAYIDLEDFNWLVEAVTYYEKALEEIADHKNTLYAAISQSVLNKVKS